MNPANNCREGEGSQSDSSHLKSLSNPLDFPSIEEVRRRFGFTWRIVSFGVPDELKTCSRAVWEKERDKAAQRMAEATAEIQQVLRAAMAGLVQHMSDKLKEDESGKPLSFHKTTVSKLTEFMSTFEFRNITDDAALQAIVTQARGLLDGVNTDDLKTAGAARARVQAGIQNVASQLDILVVRSGGRKFRFGEE